jgi:hypothetical protein
MKIFFAFTVAAITGLAFGLSVDWFTVDGGGGTSTGGAYSLSGTIGQTDAALLTGGNYTLQGGFWSLPEAVQTPGAPPLDIARAGGSFAVISWPAPSTGWQLQKSSDLQAWTPLTIAVVVQNGSNTVTAPVTPAREFYRLLKP